MSLVLLPFFINSVKTPRQDTALAKKTTSNIFVKFCTSDIPQTLNHSVKFMFLFQLLCTLIVLFASLMFTYIVIASRARGYYSSMLNNVQKLYKNMKYIPFVAKQNRERKAPDGLPFLSPCGKECIYFF